MARERSKNREETRSVKSLRLHTWRDSSLFIFHADTRTNPRVYAEVRGVRAGCDSTADALANMSHTKQNILQ